MADSATRHMHEVSVWHLEEVNNCSTRAPVIPKKTETK